MMQLDQGRFSLSGDLNHPKATGDFQTSFNVEQPLIDMNIHRAVDFSRQEFAVRTHGVEKRKQEIAFQVYVAYLEVQNSKARLVVAEKAVADAREHGRLASVRSEAGVGLKYDELRIATFLSDLEQQKISAGNEVLLARLRLGQITGLESGAMPDINGNVSAVPFTVTAEYLEKAAMINRPDLKESAAEIARSETALESIKGALWPTLYALGTYQMNDRDLPFGRENDSWMVGASFRWEFSDIIRKNGDMEKARSMKNVGEAYQNALKQHISLQINEAILLRIEAEKKLEVSRNAIKDAEEMVRLVSKRFENGLSTAVEILDARTALNRVRGQLADNESAFALATARIYQGAGLFLKEVMQ
jgi:outer membrane protein TolC